MVTRSIGIELARNRSDEKMQYLEPRLVYGRVPLIPERTSALTTALEADGGLISAPESSALQIHRRIRLAACGLDAWESSG